MAALPRLIPVLDVMGGRAVRAIGGHRDHYRPLSSVLHPGCADPRTLGLACRDRPGLRELYLADLDAIRGVAPPSLGLFRDLADEGMAAWVDSGVRDARDVGPLLDAGATTVILGLETLRGPSALREIVEAFGPDRLAASLDLRDGRPLVPTAGAWGTEDPRELATALLACGLRRLIVLDLARVGMGSGVGTLPLLTDLRAAHADMDLIAGGGVSGVADIEDLGRAGVTAVLIGSALHDGKIGIGPGQPRRSI